MSPRASADPSSSRIPSSSRSPCTATLCRQGHANLEHLSYEILGERGIVGRKFGCRHTGYLKAAARRDWRT